MKLKLSLIANIFLTLAASNVIASTELEALGEGATEDIVEHLQTSYPDLNPHNLVGTLSSWMSKIEQACLAKNENCKVKYEFAEEKYQAKDYLIRPILNGQTLSVYSPLNFHLGKAIKLQSKIKVARSIIVLRENQAPLAYNSFLLIKDLDQYVDRKQRLNKDMLDYISQTVVPNIIGANAKVDAIDQISFNNGSGGILAAHMDNEKLLGDAIRSYRKKESCRHTQSPYVYFEGDIVYQPISCKDLYYSVTNQNESTELRFSKLESLETISTVEFPFARFIQENKPSGLYHIVKVDQPKSDVRFLLRKVSPDLSLANPIAVKGPETDLYLNRRKAISKEQDEITMTISAFPHLSGVDLGIMDAHRTNNSITWGVREIIRKVVAHDISYAKKEMSYDFWDSFPNLRSLSYSYLIGNNYEEVLGFYQAASELEAKNTDKNFQFNYHKPQALKSAGLNARMYYRSPIGGFPYQALRSLRFYPESLKLKTLIYLKLNSNSQEEWDQLKTNPDKVLESVSDLQLGISCVGNISKNTIYGLAYTDFSKSKPIAMQNGSFYLEGEVDIAKLKNCHTLDDKNLKLQVQVYASNESIATPTAVDWYLQKSQ